ncbi:hypothetical protein [Methylibium sp.]|uniref:hypothetical protein n=1 Tax=Methylibium sp. TaxID=2067992 RepID=UPI003D0E7A6E
MADVDPDPKGGTSFFRKVVKFVANPATDWAELNTPGGVEEPLQSGYAKSELKAMIERKRRNDFVRKREFDVLRKIRREGLPADGLAGLQISDLDDSDQSRSNSVARPDDAMVKAKIDEIEQQMEGEVIARRANPTQPPAFYTAPTVQGALDEQAAPMNEPFNLGPDPVVAPNGEPRVPALDAAVAPPQDNHIAWDAAPAASPAPAPAAPVQATAAAAPVAQAATAVHLGRPSGMSDFGNPFAVEVNEIAHDPELDEAVISFANAEFEACERSINGLILNDGERANHAETWLVLFDLYRATGQQQPFESLALDYVQRFGWSPPQWFSIPQLVAAEAAASASTVQAVRVDGSIGWIAPAQLDGEGVAQLRAKTLQLPMPWVLDWSALRGIEPQACNDLSQLMRHWGTQKIQMRWIGAEQLLALLAETAPTSLRDADPAYWLLRLEALRLCNRPDQFDEVAIDYCVTYEVSPPSWERSLCIVKMADAGGMTLASRSMVTDVSTGFAESQVLEETGGVRTAAVELSGQLVGDIGSVLLRLQNQLGSSTVVSVNCARLIRMDFVAAGDLLNWVLQRRSENRLVHFEDAHRLLGLFFNAMGINEHARVKVRNI